MKKQKEEEHAVIFVKEGKEEGRTETYGVCTKYHWKETKTLGAAVVWGGKWTAREKGCRETNFGLLIFEP